MDFVTDMQMSLDRRSLHIRYKSIIAYRMTERRYRRMKKNERQLQSRKNSGWTNIARRYFRRIRRNLSVPSMRREERLSWSAMG